MIIVAISITIFLISAAGAVWQVARKVPDEPRQVKVLHFMLYFWPLVFIQLIIVSLGYALLSD